MLETLKEALSDEQFRDLEKFFQSEQDKLRTQYTKQIKELEQFKPVEKSEAEKALETKMAELEQKEKEVLKKEKTLELASKLKEKGLPDGLVKFLNVGEDTETDLVITDLGAVFEKYTLKESYKPEGRKKNEVISKDDFKKLGYVERVKLQEQQPELYKALTDS